MAAMAWVLDWRGLTAAILATSLLASAPASAAGEASVATIKVHSSALEGNLEGNSADRDVIVVLPPSYGTNKSKRYPVIYFLHGYGLGSAAYDGIIKYGDALTGAAARGQEFIFVAPDSMTKFGGSMYSNSATTGNFEGFIAKDLVAYVDSHYRTLAKPAARGLAGHSMGGYGTLRIAMKYPGVFSSIYAMSACCLSSRTANPATDAKFETMTAEEVAKADMGAKTTFAAASAWSPDPTHPPFFLALATNEGKIVQGVLNAWTANAPNAMLPQYVTSLKGLSAIALDVGDKDFLLSDNKTMNDLMNRFGVKHDWTIYDGDHTNRIPQRLRENVLPFFAAHLATK
jgi:enterochelin esterase-like enzyme